MRFCSIFRTFNIFRDYFQDFFYRFFQDLFCSGKGVSRSYLQFPRLRNKWTLVSGLCCGQDSGTVFSGHVISGLIPIFIRISFDFRLVSDCVKHIPAPQLWHDNIDYFTHFLLDVLATPFVLLIVSNYVVELYCLATPTVLLYAMLIISHLLVA